MPAINLTKTELDIKKAEKWIKSYQTKLAKLNAKKAKVSCLTNNNKIFKVTQSKKSGQISFYVYDEKRKAPKHLGSTHSKEEAKKITSILSTIEKPEVMNLVFEKYTKK